MGKIIEYSIDDFSGGMSDDPRTSVVGQFSIAKHFDIFSYPKKLVPYRSLEADTNDGSTATGMKQYLVRDFVYASASSKLYGLGQTGAGLTKIVYKDDATTGNWTLPASSEGNGAVKNGCFFEYKDYAWFFQGTNQVGKWGTLSGSPSITNSVATVGATITSVAQGLIGKDDNGYMFYNNVVVRISAAGSVTDEALVLPTHLKITSATRYGNYMAIACAPISTFNGKSVVYLWNYTSSDVQETLEWGDGELRILEAIEGILVGITDRYLNNSVGAGRGSMIIQTYEQGTPKVKKEVFTLALTGKTMPLSKAVKNNRLFFSAKIMTNTAGTEYHEGIWSFGRKGDGYPWALNLDIIDENVGSSGIQAFGTAANYFFIAYNTDGSIDKTNDAATYAFTSIYESQVINFGSAYAEKRLLGAAVTTDWMTGLGTVTLKYKKNSDTSWTTIGSFVNTGLSPVFQENYVNIETTGADFEPGKEYRFRIESTGGGEITGFKCRAEYLNDVNI